MGFNFIWNGFHYTVVEDEELEKYPVNESFKYRGYIRARRLFASALSPHQDKVKNLILILLH